MSAPADSFAPGPETRRLYRDALGSFATGVTVVTAAGPNGPVGITANSFASVSLDPPLVLWSPARSSSRFALFATVERFAIHVLAEDQAPLCRRFAKADHAFDGLDWHPGTTGVPLIEGCLARFECSREAAHDGGDHLVILARVLQATVRPGMPLVFSHGRYGRFTPGE